MNVHPQDIKDLCARLEEAATMSDISVDYECRAQYQNLRLRIHHFVFGSQDDCKRYKKEAEDFRMAAALLMKSISS
jgi:hypothetical protein